MKEKKFYAFDWENAILRYNHVEGTDLYAEPGTPEKIIKEAGEAFRKLPHRLREVINAAETGIFLTKKSITESNYNGFHTTPVYEKTSRPQEGYNVPPVIAIKVAPETTPGAVIHELGHALDNEIAKFSSLPGKDKMYVISGSKSWEDIYKRNAAAVGRMDKTAAKNIYNPQETFAESFRLYITQRERFEKEVPEAFSFVDKLVDQIEKGEITFSGFDDMKRFRTQDAGYIKAKNDLKAAIYEASKTHDYSGIRQAEEALHDSIHPLSAANYTQTAFIINDHFYDKTLHPLYFVPEAANGTTVEIHTLSDAKSMLLAKDHGLQDYSLFLQQMKIAGFSEEILNSDVLVKADPDRIANLLKMYEKENEIEDRGLSMEERGGMEHVFKIMEEIGADGRVPEGRKNEIMSVFYEQKKMESFFGIENKTLKQFFQNAEKFLFPENAGINPGNSAVIKRAFYACQASLYPEETRAEFYRYRSLLADAIRENRVQEACSLAKTCSEIAAETGVERAGNPASCKYDAQYVVEGVMFDRNLVPISVVYDDGTECRSFQDFSKYGKMTENELGSFIKEIEARARMEISLDENTICVSPRIFSDSKNMKFAEKDVGYLMELQHIAKEAVSGRCDAENAQSRICEMKDKISPYALASPGCSMIKIVTRGSGKNETVLRACKAIVSEIDRMFYSECSRNGYKQESGQKEENLQRVKESFKKDFSEALAAGDMKKAAAAGNEYYYRAAVSGGLKKCTPKEAVQCVKFTAGDRMFDENLTPVFVRPESFTRAPVYSLSGMQPLSDVSDEIFSELTARLGEEISEGSGIYISSELKESFEPAKERRMDPEEIVSEADRRCEALVSEISEFTDYGSETAFRRLTADITDTVSFVESAKSEFDRYAGFGSERFKSAAAQFDETIRLLKTLPGIAAYARDGFAAESETGRGEVLVSRECMLAMNMMENITEAGIGISLPEEGRSDLERKQQKTTQEEIAI